MTKKRHRRVSIISRESDSKTLDVSLLEEELSRRGIEVTVLSKLLTKDDTFKAFGYLGHVVRQEAAILRSDVVVLDTYCIPASMIPHRKGTKIIQIWHSLCAIKKFGWQTVGMSDGSSVKTAKLMRMHRGYDYVAAPSDITAGHFREAFDVAAEKIVKLGLPRIDYIKSVASGDRRADTAKRILARYPMLRLPGQQMSADPQRSFASLSKKIILYAPTFRKGKAVDVKSLTDALEEIAPGKYNVVVKLHPLYRENAADPGAVPSARPCGFAQDDTASFNFGERSDEGSFVIYDDDFPTIDWLSIADIVISDYSSLTVEASLTGKPLYLYTYDIDEYSESTGLNVDFNSEPIAPYTFKDAKALAAQIDRDCCPESQESKDMPGYDYDALRAFRDRYIDSEVTGGSGNTAKAGGNVAEETYVNSEGYCTAAMADFIEGILYR